jgi:hypothetical protein
MPLTTAPRLDDLGGDDVDEELREGAALRIAFELVGGLVPGEVRVDRHRQEQVVAVIDDNNLADRALLGGMVDEVFLGAVGADVALQREIAGDDFFDRDLLVPAVAAVAFFTARFRDFLGAAQGAALLVADRLAGHISHRFYFKQVP